MNKLSTALKLVEDSPPGFAKQKHVIRETDYSQKTFIEPFRRFSWVTGRRSVRLAYDWHKWTNMQLPMQIDGFPQANNLIHEAVHCQQIDRLGGLPAWLATYAQRPGRYRLELEAYSIQIWHVKECFQLPSYEALRGYIEGIAGMLQDDYLLFGYRNQHQIITDLIDLLDYH